MTADYDVPPIPVHVISQDKQEKRSKEIRTAHRTYVLTAANPYLQLVGYDPARKEVYVNTFDNPVVLSGDISQASDSNNITTPINAPNGRLLSITVEYTIPGQDELWVSAGVYPTKVAFTIVREID